jgi:hypothetical protein
MLLCIQAPRVLDEGARFKVEVNGGVPVHIDKSEAFFFTQAASMGFQGFRESRAAVF